MNKTKSIVFWLNAISLILCLICYPPITAHGEADLKSNEQIESEAAENYEKAKERLSTIYENAMGDVLNDPVKVLEGKSPGGWFYYHMYAIYHTITKAAPFMGSVSVLMGVILCFIIRRNKQLFKKVLFSLIIGIPLILTLFVFGVGAII